MANKRKPNVKADAWRTAAGHLEAIAQDKLSEGLDQDERKVWEHVMRSVVPSLDRRAQIIERRKP